MPTRSRFWSSIAIAAALAACASGPPPAGRRDLLEFVRPGTSRTEVVLKLGPPFASFEGERIMTWSIGEDAGGYLVSAARHGAGAGRPFARYELVVVFDAEGKALKHSLVEVHKP
jgi:hypothetical protein